MDKNKFVDNVQSLCKLKGVPPTTACIESGAGRNFIADIKRGQTPSVTKVQLLAAYLGCTVSDLLGETSINHSTGAELPPKSEAPTLVAGDLPDFIVRYNELSPSAQKEVIAFIEFKHTQELGGQHE